MIKYIAGCCFSALVLISCGGKKDNPTPDPSKASLSFPLKDAVCVDGTVKSINESTITFKWKPSENTDTYELTVKNLLTGIVVTKSSAESSVDLTLSRNMPYSWYITSASSKSVQKAQSEVWKFYSAGEASESYSPFPADLILPLSNQTYSQTNIKLSWAGSDVDNDIKDYDVYFGTNSIPELYKASVKDVFLNVDVSANKTYYWKIVTRDETGNTSESVIFQFKVI